jgi:hypothetical protein
MRSRGRRKVRKVKRKQSRAMKMRIGRNQRLGHKRMRRQVR